MHFPMSTCTTVKLRIRCRSFVRKEAGLIRCKNYRGASAWLPTGLEIAWDRFPITGKPEVIPADPIRIITSGLPTIHPECVGTSRWSAFPRRNCVIGSKGCQQELFWIASRPGGDASNRREDARNTRRAGYYAILATNCPQRTRHLGIFRTSCEENDC